MVLVSVCHVSIADSLVSPPAEQRLNEALRAGRQRGDVSALVGEMERLFRSEDKHMQVAGLAWIGHHERELSPGELIRLAGAYMAARPNDRTSKELDDSVAGWRLEAMPRQARTAIYWRAVREGRVDIGSSAPLVRGSALGRAAREGLVEFEGAIHEYAAELDRAKLVRGGTVSEQLLWELRLRSGAEDSRSADRRASQRLAEMEPAALADLMTKDDAFRDVVLRLADAHCGKYFRTESCSDLAHVYSRQEEYWASNSRTVVEGKTPSSQDDGDQPQWLSVLRRKTFATRASAGLD
jgi:hypothetical protein